MRKETTKRIQGRKAHQRNQAILRNSDICHLCGHPGADAVDHVIPLAQGGTEHADNLRPAHHTQPCATCGTRCNRVKSSKMVAPILRRSKSMR